MQRFNGHLYWFSWQDNDGSVRNAKWDWFNARNYCRKRCMDLVSFETKEEYDWVKGFINGNFYAFLKQICCHHCLVFSECAIFLDFRSSV